jgi:hypothetical protein
MKKTAILLMLTSLLLSFNLTAQETEKTRIHQVGIQFANLNGFGIHYKTGNEKTLFRITTAVLNLYASNEYGRPEDSVEIKNTNTMFRFDLGFEKKIEIVQNFDFLWGIEAGCAFQYSHSKSSNDYFDKVDSWSVQPGLYAILGVSYTLKEHLVFGAEISPGLWYGFSSRTYSKNETVVQKRSIHEFGFGFNNGSASISIAYKFRK